MDKDWTDLKDKFTHLYKEACKGYDPRKELIEHLDNVARKQKLQIGTEVYLISEDFKDLQIAKERILQLYETEIEPSVKEYRVSSIIKLS